MSFKKLYDELTKEIQSAYEEGVSLDQAERMAAKFLYAQSIFSTEIKRLDLDARMRKAGVKAVRAAIYLDAVKGGADGKKPTQDTLAAMVDSHERVEGEQFSFDKAEVERDEVERAYDIAREGHIYFRGISKGRFDG